MLMFLTTSELSLAHANAPELLEGFLGSLSRACQPIVVQKSASDGGELQTCLRSWCFRLLSVMRLWSSVARS